ncbi:hypothetical protein KPH14_009915 [Odynerus spinipes]|uniref:Cytochrome b-c1 complex subunit 8 n=1 Tax=Odynerus spinipes TaxID=1348599 RepID=A0AAD9RSU6_9HYME|nr:hypothetical protein KPH14_009915 [Odynerus spinipes]
MLVTSKRSCHYTQNSLARFETNAFGKEREEREARDGWRSFVDVGSVVLSISGVVQIHSTRWGVISEGIPNVARRFHGSVYSYLPIFGMSYLVYLWAIEENEKINRKNPDDFKNDV